MQTYLLLGHADMLCEVLKGVNLAHTFHIDAVVLLHDQLHALWTLPVDDHDYPMRWMLIKAGFSRHLLKGERCSESRAAKSERGIWQLRYWEHLICDDRDFERHVGYIHYNPVKHGYLQRAEDWLWSSFHRNVCKDVLPLD